MRNIARWWRHLSSPARITVVAAGLITGQLVFRGWAAAGSWFYSDDFLFLGTFGSGDADVAWFFTPHNIHLMPFGLWLSTWVSQAGAFAWWAAAMQIIVLQAIASLAFWWLLRTLFGDRAAILPALAMYAFVPASLGPVVWWAASLNQLPHQIAMFAFLALHVRHLRLGRRRDLVGANLALLLGLASYTKAILFGPLALVVTAGFFVAGVGWKRPLIAARRWWKAWLAYGVISALYVAIYAATTAEAPRPSAEAIAETLELSIVRALGPAVLGGPWQWQQFSAEEGVGPRLFVATSWSLVALCWAVIGAVVLWTRLHRRGGGVAALMLGGYSLASGLLIAFGRAGAFGTEAAALELRYHADLPAIAALAVVLAWLPVIGSPAPVSVRPGVGVSELPRQRWVVLAGVVIAIGVAVSSVRYVTPWHSEPTMQQRAWIATATAELSGQAFEMIDTAVPDQVVWAAAFPGNLTSRVLSPLHDRVRVPTSGVDLAILDDRGRLQSASIPGPPRSAPGPVEGCGHLVQASATTIPLAPVIDFTFWMTINYVASEAVDVSITAGSNRTTARWPAGAHTFYMQTTGSFDHVTIAPVDDTAICIDVVNVGNPVAWVKP